MLQAHELRNALTFDADEISDKDKKRLGRQMETAANGHGGPLELVVGSCPDYSNDGTYYTFEDLGEDVPLLTKLQLQANERLLGELDELGVPFRFSVLLADVEAVDRYFCDKYCDGDYDEFMRRCHSSVAATDEYLRQTYRTYRVGQLASSSFFHYFGETEFKDTQATYESRLAEPGNKLESKVEHDNKFRGNMYARLYGKEARDPDFCLGRTRRTAAQYLAIGRLLGQNSLAVMISHDTFNANVFQEVNKMEPGGQGNLPVVPVIKRKVRAYE